METGLVVLTLGVMVLFAAALVVAAFLDRRRGREIEHDLGEVGPGRVGPGDVGPGRVPHAPEEDR